MLTKFEGSGSLARAREAVAAADAATMLQLRIVAWETPGRGRARHYTVGTHAEQCARVLSCPRHMRHAYEIVCDWLPVNVFVDAECARAADGSDDDAIHAAALELALAIVERLCDFGALRAHVTLLRAHRRTKASYHLVAHAVDACGARMALENVAAVGAFMTLIKPNVSAAAWGMVDEVVYSSGNRNFRLPHCPKNTDPDSTLVPVTSVERGVQDGVMSTFTHDASVVDEDVCVRELWVTGDTRAVTICDADTELAAAIQLRGGGGGGGGVRGGGGWGASAGMTSPPWLPALLTAVLASLTHSWGAAVAHACPRLSGFAVYDKLRGRVHFAVQHGYCGVHGRVHHSNNMRITLDLFSGYATQSCFNTDAPLAGATTSVSLPRASLAAADAALVAAREEADDIYRISADSLGYLWS